MMTIMMMVIGMMIGTINFLSDMKVIKNAGAHKAQIKEELPPTALNPSRWWDWCMSEEEKKETEKLWG